MDDFRIYNTALPAAEIIIAPNETVELTATQAITYQVKATNPTGATLIYSAAKLPSGASFDTAAGIFTWTPTPTNYGDNYVTFTVSNGLYEVSQTVDFKVNLNILPPNNYTKGSYYLYQQEVERFLAAIALPDADKTALAADLAKAEGLLVRVPLSVYSFEGNANNSFGTTSGTVSGTASYMTGKIGQAISLNGTDSYVTLPTAHPLFTYNEITLATWVYWKGSSQWQRIFDFGNNTSQYLFLTPRSGSNTLRFAIKNGGGEQIVETSQLAANQWAHVAVTLGGGTAKLYVNGELKATKTGITIKPSDFKPSKNYIGKSQWPDPLFNGMIDEFRIYDHSLTDDEIKAVYNNTAEWIDKTLLPVLLEQAGGIDTELYTEESVQALQAEVTNAQAVYGKAAATQAEIDAASDELLAALKGLQWKDITTSVDPAASSGKNGWYTSPVTVTLSPAKIAEYSLDGGVTWSVYSAPVTLDQEGTHQIQYRRSVDSGEVKSLEIKIDLTAPVAQIIGAASYTIDQDILITCSVTDVISGVYGSPCDKPLLQAKAYSLESGRHNVTVTAEDMAGHQTAVTHTFTVTVTFDSLKAVTTAFLKATNAKGWDKVADSLNKLLDQAKAKAAVGQTASAKDIMADYIGQVTDQTGKSFAQAQVDILNRWARIVI
ncbi:LamG-like jellyroll fold domain-containing protein [Paenibacillus sp. Soil522]|uniref:LamG-like jellyroll fold domain-containing protein n=1 Tax=Paenibacillus sp. Soil522 TaxID=1736388 RepID=UPI003FA6F37B